MKCVFIGIVIDKGGNYGCRIIDLDNKDKSNLYIDVAYENVVATMKRGIEIVNLQLDSQGRLEGSNGSLNRYPIIEVDGTKSGTVRGNHMYYIILNRIVNKVTDETIGYGICDYKGKQVNEKTDKIVGYSELGRVSNGKIVTDSNGKKYISAINGTYDIRYVNIDNTAPQVEMDTTIVRKAGGDRGLIADTMKRETVRITKVADTFKVLTEEQLKVIQGYYAWYTTSMYQTFNKALSFGRISGRALENKTFKLDKLAGDLEWKFNGMWDNGIDCDFCSLGHRIRYTYFAIPVGDTDRSRAIKFGETCASDFFKIAESDMKVLVKIRHNMTNEINYLIKLMEEQGKDIEERKPRSVLLRQLVNNISEEDGVQLFGEKLYNTLVAFVKLNIPMVKTLVLQASNCVNSSYENRVKATCIVFNTVDKNDILKIYQLGTGLDMNKLEYGNFGKYMHWGTSLESDNEQINDLANNAKDELTRNIYGYRIKGTAFNAGFNAEYAFASGFINYVMIRLLDGVYRYAPGRDTDRQRKDIGTYNKDVVSEYYLYEDRWKWAFNCPIMSTTTSEVDSAEGCKEISKAVESVVVAIKGYETIKSAVVGTIGHGRTQSTELQSVIRKEAAYPFQCSNIIGRLDRVVMKEKEFITHYLDYQKLSSTNSGAMIDSMDPEQKQYMEERYNCDKSIVIKALSAIEELSVVSYLLRVCSGAQIKSVWGNRMTVKHASIDWDKLELTVDIVDNADKRNEIIEKVVSKYDWSDYELIHQYTSNAYVERRWNK